MKHTNRMNQVKRRGSLGVVQLNIEIPGEMHRGFKVVAAADQVSLKQWAINALTARYKERKLALKLPFEVPMFRLASALNCR